MAAKIAAALLQNPIDHKRWFLCDKFGRAAEPLIAFDGPLKTHLFTCFRKQVMIYEY